MTRKDESKDEKRPAEFTDFHIKNLKPGPKEYVQREKFRKGLGIRVRTTGAKSWVYVYHIAGKQRKATLGAYPALSLAQARKELLKARALLETGVDPGAARQEQRRTAERTARAELEEPTVWQLVDLYLERHARPRKRTADEDERILRKDILPRWGSLKAKQVTKRDVIAMLDDVAARGGTMANRTLACTRKLFNWAVTRDILSTPPTLGVSAPAKENHRDRILGPEEIRAFWLWLDDAGMTPPVKAALRFLVATGARSGEVLGLEWGEVADGWWAMPGAKVKNGRPHRLPLNGPALVILEGLERTGKYVFASPRTGSRMGETVLARALFRNRPPDIEPFNVHDLRRTVASQLAALGVGRTVIGKLLNHAERTVTGIHYDQHEYAQEKQAAMELWGRRLEQILTGEGGNVVPFAKTA